MLKRIWHTGLISLILMMALIMYVFTPLQRIYDVWLEDVVFEEMTDSNELLIVAKGGNMLRANSFYLDDRRIDECQVSRITYEEARIAVSRDVFGDVGDWHKIQLGYSKWGILNLIGSPIWIEWKIP